LKAEIQAITKEEMVEEDLEMRVDMVVKIMNQLVGEELSEMGEELVIKIDKTEVGAIGELTDLLTITT
jgi:hypothetical protein